MSDVKKIGRPTNDPKNLKLTVRFNDEQSQKIKDYSIKNNLTMSEVVRKAVDDLEQQK
ncbi:TPA: CopG family transcriptional regulator [Streptococcus suis]